MEMVTFGHEGNLQNSAIAICAAMCQNEVLKGMTAFFVGCCCVIVEMMAVAAMRGSRSAALPLHACHGALPLGFMQVLQLLSTLSMLLPAVCGSSTPFPLTLQVFW